LKESGLLCICLLRYWTTGRNQSFAVYHPPDFFNNIQDVRTSVPMPAAQSPSSRRNLVRISAFHQALLLPRRTGKVS